MVYLWQQYCPKGVKSIAKIKRIKQFLVKEIAEKKGISNPALLSRRANLGYNTVYLIWNNRTDDPGIQTLEKIATVLKVEVTDLYEVEEVEETEVLGLIGMA
jgi:transcriptional regulator with XRE-family HTH domain